MTKFTLALLAVGAEAMRVAQRECNDYYEDQCHDCIGYFYEDRDCDNGLWYAVDRCTDDCGWWYSAGWDNATGWDPYWVTCEERRSWEECR